MAQSIDELSVKITAATTRAKNSIDKLVDSLYDLRDAVSSLDIQNINSMGDALQNVGGALSNIKANDVGNTLKRIGNACKSAKKDIDSFSDSTSQGFQYPAVIKETGASLITTSKEVSTSLEGIQNNINSFDIVPFTTALSRASELMEEFIGVRQRLLTGPQSTPRYLIGEDNIIDGEWWEVDEEGIRNERNEYENLEKSILAVSDAKSTALANSDDGKATRSLSVIKQLNTALSTLSNGLKKVRNNIISVLPGFNNISKTADKSKDSFENIKAMLDRFTKSLTRNMKMLRLMVVRMGLRAIIDDAKNGLVNLIKFSNQFDGSISNLWNSARQLGNAAASAVSPLINSLAPALDKIVQLCVKAVNAVNQLISALTGNKTWSKAKTLSDDYSKSLDKSNKSAKALKNTVLGFDELNQLQDNNSNAQEDVDAFETAEVGEEYNALAEKIQKTFNDITSPIKKAWSNLGDYVVDSWKKAFNSLKNLFSDIGRDFLEVWNEEATIKMLENVFRIIGDIGNIVDALATKLDIAWNKNNTGKKILQDIRDLFAIIIEHIQACTDYTINWAMQLDFSPLLEAFEEWLTSMKPVVDAIAGVFEDFYKDVILPLTKWSIETGIPELIQVFTDFNEQVDWEGLRNNLSEFWAHLEPFAETVGEGLIIFVRDLTDALANFINSEEFENFLKSVENWMDNVTPEDVADGLKKIVNAIIAFEGTKLAVSAIRAVTTALEDFFITLSTIKTIGLLVVDFAVAVGRISALMSKLSPENFTYIAIKIVDFVKGTWLDPDEWTGLFGKIFDYIGIAWNDLLVVLGTPFAALQGLMEGGFDPKKYFDESLQSFDKYNEAIKLLEENGEKTSGTYEEIIRRADNLSAEKASNLEKLKDNISNVGNAMTIVAGASKEFCTSTDKANEKIKESSEGMGVLKEGADKVNSALDSTKEGVKKYKENIDIIPKYTKEGTDNVKPILEDFQTDFENKLANINVKDAAVDIGKNVTGGVAEGMQETDTEEPSKSFFQKVWDSIKSVFGIASPAKEMYPLGNYITLGIIEGFKEKFEEFTQTAKDFLDNIVKPAFSKDKWTLDGIKDGLKDSFEGAVEAVKRIWNNFAEWLNNAVTIDIDPIEIMGDRVFDGAHFQLFKLPTFATGGFPEDGLFMANHGEMVGRFSNGKTAVANNEQITDGIARAVYSAIVNANASSGSGNVPYINNTIQVDGETIARAVTRGQQSLNRRYSPSSSGAY